MFHFQALWARGGGRSTISIGKAHFISCEHIRLARHGQIDSMAATNILVCACVLLEGGGLAITYQGSGSFWVPLETQNGGREGFGRQLGRVARTSGQLSCSSARWTRAEARGRAGGSKGWEGAGVWLFVRFFVCFALFVCLFVCVFVCLLPCLFVCLFVRSKDPPRSWCAGFLCNNKGPCTSNMAFKCNSGLRKT